jgi:hypothetical protein
MQPRKEKPDQIRIQVNDGCFDLDLGVTDIRLYDEDHVAPNKKVVKNVGGRLREGEDVLECQRLEVNLDTQIGKVHQAKLF